MRRTGLFINWESGNKNSNAIQEFEKNGINWEYNNFGTLTADFYGSGFLKRSILNISKAINSRFA